MNLFQHYTVAQPPLEAFDAVFILLIQLLCMCLGF